MWVLTPGKASFMYTFICWGAGNLAGRQDRNSEVFSMRIAIDNTAATKNRQGSYRMKIGINTYFFKFPASGSGQYLRHLLQAIAEVDQKNTYILLSPQPISEKIGTLLKLPHIVTPVPRLARRNVSVENLMWEQYTSISAARKAGVDLLHVPYFAPPFFPRTPSVI